MLKGITVDNVYYDLVCDIARTAEIQSSDISGLLLNRQYYNDVIGTYMSYDVTIAIPVGKESTYYSLYEVLTDPVAEHVFVLPYNQSTIAVRGRVNIISDKLFKVEDNKNIWRGVRFTVISNRPKDANSSAYDDEIIVIDPNFTAENIKSNITIAGVTGTFTADATATAGDIKGGETAYVNGLKIIGTATVATITVNQDQTIDVTIA